MKILPAISESSSVFSYNRFGVAGSDKLKVSQDGLNIVNTLREALTSVGFESPFLLVGHLLGGRYANLYARLYPNEVAGIVFLESSTTKDISLNEYQGKAVKTINEMFKVFDSLSSHKQFNEVNFVEKTINQIHLTDTFPEMPVLCHYWWTRKSNDARGSSKKNDLRINLELLSLTRNSKHIVAEKSGHFPQLSEPTIVIDSINFF
ncbi:alpha/beta fold hydrolase [Peribacillus frigoritolerans]|uniref:alpha/beta fold hydrolase n=1 Tax=Peribacillus frigoritolerans TaxID=450367 RepID=UPI0020C0D77E|nr:alpha/beta fold hydrolase [Peribacillus frigoritolerans]